MDHAAEPASSRPSRPDKSGRYSRLAVRYDAGPAGSAHLGQSQPDAGPVRRPRLGGGGAGRLGRGTGPRPAHTEGLPGLSRLDSQGAVDHRRGLRRTEGTRSLRAGRSRHHHLAVPRIRTLRSGPRDQHQHQASRPEPHRQGRSGNHPRSRPEVAGCPNGGGLRKAHGHTASHRSRSGPVRRHVRERPLPVGRPCRVRVRLLRFHLHHLPGVRHHPAARCRPASRRLPGPPRRQIRVATRRSALLLARQQGPRQSRRDLPRGHVFRERRHDRGIRQDGTVRITPVRLDADYWGARRYLDQPR